MDTPIHATPPVTAIAKASQQFVERIKKSIILHVTPAVRAAREWDPWLVI